MLMNCLTNRWLKECVDLTIANDNYERYISSYVIDDSLVRFAMNCSVIFLNFLFNFSKKTKLLDPNLAKGLQVTEFTDVPAGK
jgi:hypothetical protein